MAKIKKSILIITFLFGFIAWQYYFLKLTFEIDLLARPILSDGFCKDCNVILISIDTLRAKSLPCYGYEKNTAPNLCDFAKKSFLFKNMYSPASKTLDSHFSIFTSLYPQSHTMNIIFVNNLSSEIKTLAEVFKESGYKTLFSAPLSDPHLPLKRGLERGFDVMLNASNPDGWIRNLKEADLTSNKFFAFLHTYDVHEPYTPEKGNLSKFYTSKIKEQISWDQLRKKISLDVNEVSSGYCKKFLSSDEFGKCYKEQFDKYYVNKMKTYWDTFKDMDNTVKKEFVQALYEARIYELDQKLAEFFNFLKEKNLFSKTVVVITADHGEEFLEHGGWTHGETLYSEVIKVPLIIYVPKTKPQIVEKLAGNVDIMPSILALAGISVPKDISGINLFSKKNNQFVLAQHVTNGLEAIITTERKLITGRGKKELFDLASDPEEQNNLYSKNKEKAAGLQNKMENYLNKLPIYKKTQSEPFPTWINEEQRKKLIETGYF